MLRKFFQMDWILVSTIFLLSGISLLILYSLFGSKSGFAENLFLKQLIFTAVGSIGMIFFSLLDYRYLIAYARYFYFISALFLLAVIFFGTTVHGTSGWISFGLFNFQPVEFSKMALTIFVAAFISRKKNKISEAGRLFISFLLTGLVIFLVLKQPDFGSAAIIGAIWVGIILVSSIDKKIFFGIIAIVFLTAGLSWFNLESYQKDRILNFLYPESDIKGSGYNVAQALVAVGSGGLTGKGVGYGSQSNLNFLPEKHTDFIFAVIAEELGLIGATLVIFLYGIIFLRLKKISEKSENNFGFLLTFGILVMLFSQTVINIGMNVGLVPVVGIPLPFLSYGGSSLLFSFICVGISLSVNQSSVSNDAKVLHSY